MFDSALFSALGDTTAEQLAGGGGGRGSWGMGHQPSCGVITIPVAICVPKVTVPSVMVPKVCVPKVAVHVGGCGSGHC